MNTPETINIEKYAEALNNLVGMDIGYLGDSDENVNAIIEVIVAAKKLEDRVKELEAELNELKAKRYLKYTLHSVIDLPAVLENTRKDAINDFVDELLKQSHQEYLFDGIDNYYCLTYQQIEQIIKTVLGE